MTFTIENPKISFSIDESGDITSFKNKTTGVELIEKRDCFFRLIYKDEKIDENTINGSNQEYEIISTEEQITVAVSSLKKDNKSFDISAEFIFRLQDEDIISSYELTNNSDVDVMEINFPMIKGVKSISKDYANDSIYIPKGSGYVICNPHDVNYSDLVNIRKYEGPEREHTNFYAAYPGDAAMQWYELDGDRGGLYMASYDTTWQTTLLALEKDTKSGLLSFGFIKYPFLKKGMSEKSMDFHVSLHEKDWHYGAKKYRKWANATWWTKPESPEWMKEFNGWLRIIMKNQYGAMNFKYEDMERLYKQTDETHMNTLFVLGWIPGGFSKKWPEFVADDDLGGEAEFKKQIEAIHKKGGKVFAFVSYFIIDPDTDYYKETGHKIALKNVWGREVLFSETYYDEGTWRKIINGNKPMIAMCPSTPEWQQKMLEVADSALSYGVDGVLYDIGGSLPHACHDESHPHEKPTLAFATKDKNYRELRENIKKANPNAVIAMENSVDIFGQYMDLAQPTGSCNYEFWHNTKAGGSGAFPEMYRYTFPEHAVTNRDNGHDEVNMKKHVNYAFLFGMRYDMSIFRCKGELDEIPNYKNYLAKVNKLRLENDILLNGSYCDEDYFENRNQNVFAKSYIDGETLAIALWNDTDTEQKIDIEVKGYKLIKAEGLEGQNEHSADYINSDSIMLLLYQKN
jgi:hypothetical protein